MGSTFTFKFLKTEKVLSVVSHQGNANGCRDVTRDHCTPSGSVTAKRLRVKSWPGCGEAGTLSQCWWEGKWDSSFGNQLGSFLKCSVTPALRPHHPTLRYLPKRKEGLAYKHSGHLYSSLPQIGNSPTVHQLVSTRTHWHMHTTA